MNIKHNKLKNTGILFELLVRKIAADVLDGKSDSFAVKLMREHFHPKTELGKELQLYRTFFNSPKLSETKSFNILDLVLTKRKTLNEKLLNAQKFLLIKEIKENCDLKQFMSGRVPSYKVYASIYKLFESGKMESSVFHLNEIASSRFVVVEHLQGLIKEEKIVNDTNYTKILKEQPKEIRHLSCKILVETFNETYNGLNDRQKNLLRQYINKGTSAEFSKYIAEEANVLSKEISIFSKKIKDNVTKIKINEVVSQLNTIHEKPVIKENNMTALLIAYELSHELQMLS